MRSEGQARVVKSVNHHLYDFVWAERQVWEKDTRPAPCSMSATVAVKLPKRRRRRDFVHFVE
jgi:hypothetical protein